MAISYLKHKEIDINKWDSTISKSYNSLVYAYSWYLDIVAEDWEALIENDYERVMPLVPGIKLNIPYLFQPFLAPQLGIFSIIQLDAIVISNFLTNLPSKYKYVEINLNKYNYCDLIPVNQLNKTYQLDLIQPYDVLFQSFSERTCDKQKQIKALGITVSIGLQSSMFVKFIQDNNPEMPLEQSRIILKVVSFTLSHKLSQIFCAYDNSNNLCGVAFFVVSKHAAHNLIISTTKDFDESVIATALIDKFIGINCEKFLTVSFEDTSKESFTALYRDFNATEFSYPTYKASSLSWFAKIFKRISSS